MRKLAVVLVTGWLYTCLAFSSFPSGAAIAAPSITRFTQTSIANTQAFSEVETFLHSIPSDYYAIQQIGTLKASIKAQNALLIDVREPPEFSAGYIEGAINIPLRSLTDSLNQIPKDRPVILYCSSGYRTAMGVMSLQMLGYNNVKGFPPSIQGWKAAGESLAKDTLNY